MNPLPTFLDLPGEVRNSIYAYVMHNDSKHIGTELARLVHRPRAEYPPQASGYRGLTQLCRQVRKEFFPMFQERCVYLGISIRDLEGFISTFYDFEGAVPLSRVRGSIEIELGGSVGDTLRSSTEGEKVCDSVDLLPLMRLLLLAPNLQARFAATAFITPDGMPKYIYDLCLLLRIPKAALPKTRHHLLYSLDRMLLDPLPVPGYMKVPSRLLLSFVLESMFRTRQMVFRESGLLSFKELELFVEDRNSAIWSKDEEKEY